MKTDLKRAATVLVVVSAMPLAAVAQDDDGAMVEASRSDTFGQYLVDAQGMSLYMLETDTQGAGDGEAESVCYDECAEEWPVLTTTGEPQAGEQVDGAMLATIERDDGSMQVTYNGWPLYYYHDDQAPGDTEGQAVHDDWGGWYLLAPSGEVIEAEGP